MNQKESNLLISIIILTFNEEKHIERCINSINRFAEDIFIVDSFSTDKTVEIAKALGVKVYQNPWENNYAKQFNWGLQNCPIKTKWVMRMDADEYVTQELAKEIKEKLQCLDSSITGILIKRRVYFMGQWIKHGGYYPIELLRIWRYGKGYCEERWMDEHIKITEGITIKFDHDIVDDNKNNLTWWTTKHNNYATREAIDILNTNYEVANYEGMKPKILGTQAEYKRWLKIRYSTMPLFFRSFFYFVYRYFFRFGFLDGCKGFIWHFLQGFWYRFLVDAKIYEMEKRTKNERKNIKEIVEEYLRQR